jgi:shikimate kinase
MATRAPLYRRVATMRVDTNRRNPGAVVRYIVSRLQDPQPAGGRRSPWRRASPATPEAGEPPTPATQAALAAARRAEAGK